MPDIEAKVVPWDGKVITNPGIYSRIPIDLYHSQKICDGPSVSSTGLRTLCRRSAAHFFDEWSGNPDHVEPETTKAMVLGRAAHHLVLGDVNFAKSFAMPPDEYPDRVTGELKKWTYGAEYCRRWRAKQEKQGLAVLSQDMGGTIVGMSRALGRNTIVGNGGLSGLIEHSIFWRDEATGLWIKIRPDAIPTTSADAVDLKTAHSVMHDDLQDAIYQHGYHQQGALVLDGFKRILGLKNPTFTLIFVESKRPFCVAVYALKEHEIERGDRQNRFALDKIARCIDLNEWPGPADGSDARYIEMKEWAQKRIDNQLQFET